MADSHEPFAPQPSQSGIPGNVNCAGAAADVSRSEAVRERTSTNPHQAVWIITDAAGFVIRCSASALQLLGYSARGARRRELPNMFLRGRPQLHELLRAARGEVIEREAEFRPNDRKSVRVRFRLTAGEALPDGAITLLWTFDVRWQLRMRLPEGSDRRQLITLWRTEELHCLFLPGGPGRRRLFLCSPEGEVLHEEEAASPLSAFERAGQLKLTAHTHSFFATERKRDDFRADG